MLHLRQKIKGGVDQGKSTTHRGEDVQKVVKHSHGDAPRDNNIWEAVIGRRRGQQAATTPASGCEKDLPGG